MNLLVQILYTVTLAAIQLWRMLMYVIAYIGFKPAKSYLNMLLNKAGIGPDGTASHNIVIHNDRLYHRLICDGTLGLGEAYAEGWWDCKKLDEFFYRVVATGFYKNTLYPWNKLINYLSFELFNLQTVKRSREVADKHYDLGNHLYRSFLGASMTYSCAYWKDATNLDEAQQHKMELIGRKLKLKPGMRVLDLGCGWGALCKFLAETYNVEVVGVTISKDGAADARIRCKDLPVDIRLQDYREINEIFDRIVAVEILEHVGRKNYRSFFELTSRCLSADGIFLIHCSGHDSDIVPPCDIFVNKYIYPNSIAPNVESFSKGIHELFCLEDLHNFGTDYEKTLMAWHGNFVKNWPTIRHMFENPEKFYRMWTYSMLMGAGIFRARGFQVWQIVLTKRLSSGYVSVR